jgi:hypothetical protein
MFLVLLDRPFIVVPLNLAVTEREHLLWISSVTRQNQSDQAHNRVKHNQLRAYQAHDRVKTESLRRGNGRKSEYTESQDRREAAAIKGLAILLAGAMPDRPTSRL